MDNLNKSDFYELYAKCYGKSKRFSKEVCDNVFDLLASCVRDYDRVYIMGLGTFKKKIGKPRKFCNVRTGELTVIPEKKRLYFEPHPSLVKDE